jgi:SAM-dependent methyltransferase
MKTEKCPMCSSDGVPFYQETFYECNTCEGLFRPKSKLPSYQKEKERYLKHQNDPEDEGYQQFVKPLTDLLIANHTNEQLGLDFGAGNGSAVHKQLSDNGFNVKQYDPIYYNNPDLLNGKYDYIYACEVIEHFHHPYHEFSRLFRMLNEGGSLYCKTNIYDKDIDFDNWYYKNDFTHVFIYKNNTFNWIADNFNPADMKINENIIHFRM